MQRLRGILARGLHLGGTRRHTNTQARRLITRRSQVQILPPLLRKGPGRGPFLCSLRPWRARFLAPPAGGLRTNTARTARARTRPKLMLGCNGETACAARPAELRCSPWWSRGPRLKARRLEIELGYRLAAARREAAEDERLTLLEQLYDPVSRRRRALVEQGWRCLEVGAGRGSMAVWLAEQVGPAGQVVVTDIDTRYLQRLDLPNLEVLQHNILDDSLEVLGPGSFDLVCSRLTLFHLVGRQEVAIRQMTECLRPGGWLIDEDADWGTAAPIDPTHSLYGGYQRVWRNGDWWTSRG